MDVDHALSALGRLGSTARSAAPAPTTPAPAGAGGASFDRTCSARSSPARVSTIEAGEAAAIQGMQGAVPPFKVVEAVMGAQRTLQAAPGDPRQGRLRLSGNHPHGDLSPS